MKFQLPEGPPEMLAALRAASSLCGPSEAEILSPSREKRVVRARHMAMMALASTGRHSLSDIGGFFNRDHSTVVHAIQSVKHYLRGLKDTRTREEQEHILGEIRGAARESPALPPLAWRGVTYEGTRHVPVYTLKLSLTDVAWLHGSKACFESHGGHVVELGLAAAQDVPKTFHEVFRVESGRSRYVWIYEQAEKEKRGRSR